MTTPPTSDEDAEDLQAVHDLLGAQDAGKDARTLLGEQYAAIKHKDPDPHLDIDYVLISMALQWGAEAAIAGVMGNAIYDGAKSAVRAFVRRRRGDRDTGLDADEARAFALYVLAYLVVSKKADSFMWRDSPPQPISIERENGHWICRFEKQSLTRHREKKRLARDRMHKAMWIEAIELRVAAADPSIPGSHYRRSTELRLATSAEARLAEERLLASTFSTRIDEHGLGRRQETEWKQVGAPMPPLADQGGGCGI